MRTRAAAILSLAAVGLGAFIATGSPAHADPKQYSAVTGVGSDTSQDVMNALAGFSSGNNYPEAQSSAATGKRQIASWDATGSACITPKAPGATFTRPNGSSAGRRALSRAIEGGNYDAASCGGGTKPVSGLVQFARSSAGPSTTGTDLTYIPFARDALSFGYYVNGTATPVTTLTAGQLQSLFTTGPQVINGTEIVPCGLQTSSGTYQFWNSALVMTAGQEATGTATCNNAAAAAGLNASLGGRSQENDGNGLKARGDLPAFANKQVIIGFSAANFISQSNGVVTSQLPAGNVVDLGAIDALGKPYSGTGSNLVASSGFYASPKFGRDIYNVLSKTLIDNPGNNDIKTIFVGPSSGVCSQTATIQAFGFLGLGASCGSTSLSGPFISGTL